MTTAWLQRFTGARPAEQKQVWACFASLLCLLASYYLVKPLRNSQFLKEFLPESLPLYYLLVSALSFAATKVFRTFYHRLTTARLLTFTFATICLGKVLFYFWLSYGGRHASIAFFLFASIYFLLALSITWARINDIFTAPQGERCFGFVATGATLGSIVGSEMASRLVNAGPASLLVSAFFMMASLGLLLAARSTAKTPSIEETLPSSGLWSELRELLAHRYLRRIAVMVVGLAIYTTGVDFISQKQMDHRLAESQYRQDFAVLNGELNQTQHADPQQLNAIGFEFIYALRTSPPDRLEGALKEFARAQRLPAELGRSLPDAYQSYRQHLNLRTRLFFSDTFFYQGVCGVLTLILVLKGLFRLLGVRGTALLLPGFSLAGLVLFSTPLSLELIQILLVLGGTLNYAINNATKEVFYTVVSTDAKYKIKPLIDGPGMRFGDVIASVVSLLCGYLVTATGLPIQFKDQLYLIFCGLCVLIWLGQIHRAGVEYERLRDAGS